MHFLVVGLGNPGKKYLNNRHNVGFCAVDLFAKQTDTQLNQKKFSSHMGSVTLIDKRVLLLKPMTYMNLSGKSVSAAVNYLHIPCEQVAVIYDDMDLDLGRLHIKQGGGSGGHRGLRSLLDELHCDDFIRFRIGIGHPAGFIDPADYVLQSFDREELSIMDQTVARTVESIACWLKDGLTAAMNRYNPWPLDNGI